MELAAPEQQRQLVAAALARSPFLVGEVSEPLTIDAPLAIEQLVDPSVAVPGQQQQFQIHLLAEELRLRLRLLQPLGERRSARIGRPVGLAAAVATLADRLHQAVSLQALEYLV